MKAEDEDVAGKDNAVGFDGDCFEDVDFFADDFRNEPGDTADVPVF